MTDQLEPSGVRPGGSPAPRATGPKVVLKRLLGDLPLAAELYWQLRQNGRPLNKAFSLRRIQNRLPVWSAQAAAARQSRLKSGEAVGKRITLFTTLRYWIEHGALLGMALAGLGHDVTLAYLPYANWRVRLNRFDLRRHNIYAQKALSGTSPLLQIASFFEAKSPSPARAPEFLRHPYGLPETLALAIEEISLRDVQYTLQLEEVDLHSDLYHLRLERNSQAARAALNWMQVNQPDVLLTPNGSILEMGAVYAAARHLGIAAVTYEFGEQKDRIWFTRNGEVMRQDTDELWAYYKDRPLTEAQLAQIRALYTSRQRASLWENFARRWQGQPGQGGEKARQSLKLDSRPLVLLAANVIGDSLTLGRQVFSQSMTEWLQRTLLFFSEHPEAQLVVRVHPGERYTKGPSVAQVVRTTLPDLPAHIHLVEADEAVNTYDLIEVADLGLVYTTTVGMEMAMSGVPVAVAGQTHYRNRGFTLDAGDWQAYFAGLAQVLADPASLRLSQAQVAQAWRYAYRFYFDYPCAFPWHLLYFWDNMEQYPLDQVLSAAGQQQFGEAFRGLAGERRDWSSHE